MSAMKRLFELMAERRASDIFISAGAPFCLRCARPRSTGGCGPADHAVLSAAGVDPVITTPSLMMRSRSASGTTDRNEIEPKPLARGRNGMKSGLASSSMFSSISIMLPISAAISIRLSSSAGA